MPISQFLGILALYLNIVVVVFIAIGTYEYDINNLRVSPTGIVKIITEKVQIFILATHFSIHTPTDSLFYSLFSLNIILCVCERERERE